MLKHWMCCKFCVGKTLHVLSELCIVKKPPKTIRIVRLLLEKLVLVLMVVQLEWNSARFLQSPGLNSSFSSVQVRIVESPKPGCN